MIMRAVVTGGAGFIGSHLVDYLVEAGCAVTVLDDLSTGSRANLEQACQRGEVRIVEGSVLDPAAIAEVTRGAHCVYHLAVQCVRRSLDKPIENHDVNATGTLNVLEAARRARVGRVVYCSSSEVYGNASAQTLDEGTVICEPVTVYGAAKLAGEHYANAYYRTYGLETVVVRPFNAYGPREHDQGDLAEVIPRFVIRVLNGLAPVIFGSGENGRDFTYVTDTARGLAMAGDRDGLAGECVNIAYGRMLTIKEVADTVTRLCQRPDLEPVHIESRPGDVYRLQASTRRAEELLGYRAGVDFEQGVGMYLDWFSARYPDPSLLLEDDPVNWRMPDAG